MKKDLIKVGVFSLFLMLFIVACNNNSNNEREREQTEVAESIATSNETDDDEDEYITEEVVHTDMSYFNFDKIEDLESFFREIESKHEKIVYYEENTPTVVQCIRQIEKYRKGERKYYPDSLVIKSLADFGLSAANICNHRPGVDLTYAEWFMMLVAYYSPDITYLVDMQSPDHLVGVLNFGKEYNSNPWWSYIFVKREKGYEVRLIGGDDNLITKLYQLEDINHKKYYLCSNHDSEYLFMPYLYFFDKNKKLIEKIPECDIKFPDVDYDEIYFSPEHLEWILCKQNRTSGKLIPAAEKPLMKLELKGEKSRFTSYY